MNVEISLQNPLAYRQASVHKESVGHFPESVNGMPNDRAA
jgi:hypothetical protein